jgi:hypothetical protein
MSDDLLERLGRENPVPERMPALPIESILARIDEPPTAAHAHSEPVERTDRRGDGELSKRPAWRPRRCACWPRWSVLRRRRGLLRSWSSLVALITRRGAPGRR